MWWHYTSKGKNTERRKSACNEATKRNEMKEQNQQWWWILLTLSNFHMSAIIFEQHDYDMCTSWRTKPTTPVHTAHWKQKHSHTATQTFGDTFWKRTWFLFTSNIKWQQMTTNNKVGILTQLEKGFCCKPSLSLYNWDPSSPWTRHGSTT